MQAMEEYEDSDNFKTDTAIAIIEAYNLKFGTIRGRAPMLS